jgi:hypothetical protein
LASNVTEWPQWIFITFGHRAVSVLDDLERFSLLDSKPASWSLEHLRIHRSPLFAARFLLSQDAPCSNSSKCENDSGVCHNGIWPVFLGSLAEKGKILFGHFDVHLNGSFHDLLNQAF